ncbi:putative serine protease YyxA [Alicyclobacillus cellulosilyticus]|uniref:Serine protease YyxA n=1 Tax=Alicyclobacillus cellulosilyticus TaxID=1003997 RepID=A0A917NJG6_9BACL|nr:trypsin-like peptidase domain-containing protein [Alicyclobacillus cellulosilyticus]GGJ02326.1 putative serine protease YyxA [Alicyclobacillus cellulosilyticus]
MGFYQDRKPRQANRRLRASVRSAARFASVVVLSALVGSGATLAAIPVLEQRGLLGGGAEPVTNTAANPSQAPATQDVVPTSVVSVSTDTAITRVVKQAEPAVVAVVNYGLVSNFFTQQTQLQEQGVGSGVLFYKDSKYGYIVTNNHVVNGAAKIQVVLSSGRHVQASVVGTDMYTDLAVLRVPVATVRAINPLPFANSDNIQVGEPAIAIGNPMGLDFADSVTAGIISGDKRMMPVESPDNPNIVLDYQAVIQTDAAINPGNSGGPLLNIEGQVVGINSSKISAPDFEGMGFAIPSNEVKTIAEQIIKTGHAVHPSLGIQGWSLSTIPSEYWPNVPVDYGVYVQSVDSAQARAAGLKPQDVIVGFNGKTVQDMADLRTDLFQVQPGQTVTLKVYRGSQLLTLKVKVGQMTTQNTSAPTSDSLPDNTNPFGSFFGSWPFGN